MKTLRLCGLAFISVIIFSCAHQPRHDVSPVQVEQFLRAAARGELADIQRMVAEGVWVDCSNKAGSTALMVSSHRGYTSVVKFLLDHGASVGLADKEKTTALQYAILGKSLPSVRLLLDHHANVNEVNKFTLTPLMMAARFATPEICKELIAAGADINATDPSGWSPIFFTVPSGNLEIMDIFLKAQARLDFKDEDGENLLMIAADYKQLAAAKAFINTKKLNLKDVNKDGESALYVAVREKFFPLVELYLQSGVDPNIPRADGRTALYEAIDQRDQKIARSLYRHGASLTPKDTDGLDGKEYLLKKDLKLKWLVGS